MAIAVLTTLTANINRNTKAQNKPFKLNDFLCWSDVSEDEQPPAAAGAAMLEMIQRKQFPSFALAFFSELKAAGKGQSLPPRLIWAADDALLLAPYRVDQSRWGGFLIAAKGSSGQERMFWSEDGDSIALTVPDYVAERGAVMAEEGAVLPIAGFPDAFDSELPPPQQSSGSTPG